MTAEDEVWFYGKSTTAADVLAAATPLFKVKNVSWKYDLTRTVNASQKVPGSEYSKGQDAQCIQGNITIEGEFIPTDAAWETTNYTGRSFDFIHQLKCFLNGLDATTGARLASSDYNCFSILIKQTLNATARTYAPGIFATTIKNYYMVGKVSFSMDGQPARTVKFNIPLIEVSDAVNLGRVT